MSEPNSSVVSSKKITACAATYIWNSPCLKPLVFNPFVVSIIILIIIWVIDYIYGKSFSSSRSRQSRSTVAVTVQHLLTSYAIIATGIAMNNIIIKHHYRMDRFSNTDHDEPLQNPDPVLISSYE
jgi:hypothetical protein